MAATKFKLFPDDDEYEDLTIWNKLVILMMFLLVMIVGCIQCVPF